MKLSYELNLVILILWHENCYIESCRGGIYDARFAGLINQTPTGSYPLVY